LLKLFHYRFCIVFSKQKAKALKTARPFISHFCYFKKNIRKRYSRVKTVWKKLLKKDFIKMSNVRDYFIFIFLNFLAFKYIIRIKI
jgi:hypothetical protein